MTTCMCIATLLLVSNYQEGDLLSLFFDGMRFRNAEIT
jgi:hypothetical protein